MARRSVSPDEFHNWLSPEDALGRLPTKWPEKAKRKWIADRLKDGLIRSAGRRVIDLKGRPEFLPLAWSDWVKWSESDTDHFWQVGDYDGMANCPNGDGTYISAPFKAYGVRFDPAPFDERDEEQREKNTAGWNKLAEALQPTLSFWEQQLAKGQIPDVAEVIAADRKVRVGVAPSASAFEDHQSSEIDKPLSSLAKPPKVTQKELLAWYKGQFAENPNSPFSQVKGRAGAHFHPRPVTRRPLQNIIAQMGHGLSPGNPLIRRK